MNEQKLKNAESDSVLKELEHDIIQKQTMGVKAYNCVEFLKKLKFFIGLEPELRFTIQLLVRSYLVHDAEMNATRSELGRIIGAILLHQGLSKISIPFTSFPTDENLLMENKKDHLEISISKPGGVQCSK